MSDSEVTKLVASIEMEMFDIFRNTDSKYMNKYRTIMFNLKDPRNKVCSKFIMSIIILMLQYIQILLSIINTELDVVLG